MNRALSDGRVDADLLERGRRCVYGFLGPYILHETNNVLTVMSGIRQLMKIQQTLPERVGPMIDGQLEKVEFLLSGIRQIGPEEPTRGGMSGLVDAVEQLLQLAGKGRKLTVTRSIEGVAPWQGDAREPLGLGLLCATLPLLPPREQAGQVNLGARGEEGCWQVTAEVSPAALPPGESPDVLLGREILDAASLRPVFSGGAGGTFRAEVQAG